MIRDAKLDLEALRKASEAARQKVENWPVWKQEVVRAVSAAASSSSSRKALQTAFDNTTVKASAQESGGS